MRQVTRRQLAQLLPGVIALPAASALLASWLEASPGAHGEHSTDAPPEPTFWNTYEPRFFGKEDFEALEACTEMLIPTDETPGAREAHCAHFIDFVLDASADARGTQQQWRAALDELRRAGFHAADGDRRRTILEQISLPERDGSKPGPAFKAYLLLKRENAFAFYTSRAGTIDALDYRGNSYNVSFPACTHPEHHAL